MKNLIYIFGLCIFFVLNSCQDDDPSQTVDLINVVRDGATIPAYIYGNTGSEVFIILLHGGPGSNALTYRGGRYTDELEEDYAMVYTDQRSQGMSQGNPSESSLTPENMAGDVHALSLSLREKYGDDISLFLMGHSWGGLLGTQVMINDTYAAQFKGWIEVDGAHDMEVTYRGGVRKIDSIANEQIGNNLNIEYWETALNQINELDTTVINSEDFSTINTLAYEAEGKLIEDGVVSPADLSCIFSTLNNIYFINNNITSFFTGVHTNNSLFVNFLREYSLTDQLEKIKKPTLLLWGKYDMVVSDELGYSALKLLGTQDKELVIFERSGHSPMSNEPIKFVDEVKGFVERLK